MLKIRLIENNENSKQKIKKVNSKINISNFGGLLGVNSIWGRLELGKILEKTGIKKQKGNISTEDIALVCINQPLINATSESELATYTSCNNKDIFVSSKQIIQKQINRFTNNKNFHFKPFYNESVKRVREEPNFAIEEDEVIIIDDCPIEKTGKHMKGIKKLFNHAKKYFYIGFELVGLSVVRSNQKFFLDVELPKGSGRKNKRKIKQKVPIITKLTIAFSMIKKAKNNCLTKAKYITFDTWYTAVKFLKNLANLGLIFSSPVKRNRKFIYEGKKTTTKDFINMKKRLHCKILDVIAVLPNYGEVKVIVYKRRLKKNGFRYEVLISNGINLSAKEIIGIFSKRWSIETLFREAKQSFKLEYFHNRNKQAIIAHIVFSLLAMLLLQLIRSMYDNMKKHTLGFLKRNFIKLKVLVKIKFGSWDVELAEDCLFIDIFKGLNICFQSV